MQRIMLTVRVKVRAIPPHNRIRLLCFKIAQSRKFEYFIIACIILNTVVLTMDYYDKPDAYGVSPSSSPYRMHFSRRTLSL